MRTLTASELLAVWEQGTAQQPVQQALLLLAMACPEASPDELAKLPIGRRDACLLTLREWTFGPQLVSVSGCPDCGERLELTFNAADIQAASVMEPTEETEVMELHIAGYELRFRLPNSLDLAAIASLRTADYEDVTATRSLLLERCLLAVHHNSEERSASELPEHVVEAIAQAMEQVDPQANVQLALNCPSCGHKWQSTFDIVSFFWSEINAWAYSLLHEVHLLASAYGWRESDILALSPWRRRFYLERVGG